MSNAVQYLQYRAPYKAMSNEKYENRQISHSADILLKEHLSKFCHWVVACHFAAVRTRHERLSQPRPHPVQ